ncbi:flagellar protein FlgN [Salipaludibacillus agaradhaerens]|uniref:Flagellar protein FlgN n=1 Tax=Salipaludibacillus agaradhaerens TaxID=76935 RepID=A0A9Q4AYV1_SALAG|nr:flagellar protein FlgN [Salipaludibacillus agaradhaerens]MCR6095060.1 flagellar protein FlgN [Salipaludibacillus agaradhaerens]MCR6115382.1 flagellar protein FlgN [Salipaludibacillus agaradhaerens]
MVEQLIQILQAMTVVHERFNEQAVRKEEIIKKGNIEGLEQIMKEESPFIQKLRKLENARQTVIRQWMEDKGIFEEEVTMAHLLPLFPESEREQLHYWQQRLMTEIHTLKQQNDLNHQLLEDSLRFVNFSIDVMSPKTPFSSYSHDGRNEDFEDKEGSGPSLFDSKA